MFCDRQVFRKDPVHIGLGIQWVQLPLLTRTGAIDSPPVRPFHEPLQYPCRASVHSPNGTTRAWGLFRWLMGQPPGRLTPGSGPCTNHRPTSHIWFFMRYLPDERVMGDLPPSTSAFEHLHQHLTFGPREVILPGLTPGRKMLGCFELVASSDNSQRTT